MLRFVVLLLSVFTVGFARRHSPHADLIDQFYSKNGPEFGRYSNNLIEDAKLDVPGLISKYGYPVEVHNVVTEDGYILEVQRIPHGRNNHNRPDPNKPAVLVMHGLFSSAADFVLMGPGTALAYILAEEGFDVWLGNARGTYYSRKHTRLNPDRDSQFWRYSWEEMGTRDLPAMIDHILRTTRKSRLHYIGHSQGTTVFWTMASLRPEYNDKIISMQALAPVAYLHNNQFPLFRLIAPFANNIVAVAERIGVNELLPNVELFTKLGQRFCSDESLTQAICSSAIFFLAGRSEDMHNATMLPVKLGHTPAGSSVRQLAHYGQLIGKNYFRRYDYGRIENRRVYRSSTPPSYDLSKVTAPVFLHYVDDDIYAHVTDVRRLFRELGRPVGMFRVQHPTFSHLDFMWGTEAKSLLYDRFIAMMKSLPNN